MTGYKILKGAKYNPASVTSLPRIIQAKQMKVYAQTDWI